MSDPHEEPATGVRPASGAPPRLIAIAAALAALLAAGIIVLANRHGSQPGPGTGTTVEATSTDPAAFVLPKLGGGGVVRLADYRGRPLVVNFFASWCTACRGEAPGFLAVDSALHGAVQFVGVDALETGDGMTFARELGYTRWPLAVDGDGGLHDALGGLGMPITAFYDKDGNKVFVAPGAMTADTLRAKIHDLFGLDASAGS